MSGSRLSAYEMLTAPDPEGTPTMVVALTLAEFWRMAQAAGLDVAWFQKAIADIGYTEDDDGATVPALRVYASAWWELGRELNRKGGA